MKEITIKVMDVETDGLPIPDSNKNYYVLYTSGDGVGTYNYDYALETDEYEDIVIDGRSLHIPIYKKLETASWFLDFDSVGHEDEIITYFEIPEDL
jgi:hypothetical protein